MWWGEERLGEGFSPKGGNWTEPWNLSVNVVSSSSGFLSMSLVFSFLPLFFLGFYVPQSSLPDPLFSFILLTHDIVSVALMTTSVLPRSCLLNSKLDKLYHYFPLPLCEFKVYNVMILYTYKLQSIYCTTLKHLFLSGHFVGNLTWETWIII